jgi:2-dehydropantoate 2-reductase
VFPRIPRNSLWLYDNIYAGRVANRRVLTQYGSYWWPRRKADCRICVGQGGITLRRHYNGHAAERRKNDTPEEIPFVQGFPRPTEDRKPSLPNILPEEASHSGTAAQGRGRQEIEEIEEQEEIPQETVDIGESTPHTSKEEVETVLEEYTTDLIGLDSFDDSDGAVKKPPQFMDPSDSSPSITTDSIEIPTYALEDAKKPPPNENNNAMKSVTRSREDSAARHENRKWVPMAERENTNEKLQRNLDIDQRAELELDTQYGTIHILGTGPSGKYIAHALAELPDAPMITLLMHKPLLMQQWHEEGASIQLLKNGKINTVANFNIESSSYMQRQNPQQRFPGFGENLEHTAEPPNTVIDCLIVTTDGHTTIAALSAIKHRLRQSSTICFIQDGLGVVNLANSSVFPNPDTRPSYMLGNMSHDLVPTQRKFTLYEKQPGRIFLTMTPRNLSEQESKCGIQKGGSLIKRMDYSWTPASTFLMRTLSRTSDLGAVGLAPTEFYEMQLQKLAINSVIGPLSVMYDCFNDELLCNYQVSRSMKMLLQEISTILHKLPEISRSARIEKRFSAETLESIIVRVLGRTGKNSTKMREAVRKGERTDVDFYNGYLVNRAMELGINCPHLEMMLAMVKGKQAMKSKERNTLIPFKV